MEWEKKIANSTSDKGLVSKIYKAVIEFNIKIIPNYLIKKWKDDLNRHFSKENIHMASRYMKRCPMSLLIRELQIKTTTSYYLTPVRMAVTKKKKKKKKNKPRNSKCRWGYGENRSLGHCWWECKLV